MNPCFNMLDSLLQHPLWLLNQHQYMYDDWLDLSLRSVFQLSLMNLGSRFSCKEGFLMRLNCISCAQPESPNMLSCLFYFYGSTPVLWLSCILDIFFYFCCKQQNIIIIHKTTSQYLILYLKLKRFCFVHK